MTRARTTPKSRPWTEEEDRILVSLFDLKKANWCSIGNRLNRHANVCAQRYQALLGLERAPIKTIAEIDVIKRIPLHTIEDRERRTAAREQRDEDELTRGVVTSSFFNDPPPGYSALDRRRA